MNNFSIKFEQPDQYLIIELILRHGNLDVKTVGTFMSTCRYVRKYILTNYYIRDSRESQMKWSVFFPIHHMSWALKYRQEIRPDNYSTTYYWPKYS